MTKYTDDQINEAIQKAAAKNTPGPVYAWELSMYKKVIDALPEPQDDWQECGFNDFRPTDKRVKAVFIGGSILEGTPDRSNSEHVFLVDGPVIHSYDDATFYRIPSPVPHPDPAEHPIIMEQGGKGWVWNAQHEMYYQPHSTEYRFPEGFTEWSPAQINSDEPAEAPR